MLLIEVRHKADQSNRSSLFLSFSPVVVRVMNLTNRIRWGIVPHNHLSCGDQGLTLKTGKGFGDGVALRGSYNLHYC